MEFSSCCDATECKKYKYVIDKMKKMVCCSSVSPSQIVHNLLAQAAQASQTEKNISSEQIIKDDKRDG
jgi:hypothetical protein